METKILNNDGNEWFVLCKIEVRPGRVTQVIIAGEFEAGEYCKCHHHAPRCNHAGREPEFTISDYWLVDDDGDNWLSCRNHLITDMICENVIADVIQNEVV